MSKRGKVRPLDLRYYYLAREIRARQLRAPRGNRLLGWIVALWILASIFNK